MTLLAPLWNWLASSPLLGSGDALCTCDMMIYKHRLGGEESCRNKQERYKSNAIFQKCPKAELSAMSSTLTRRVSQKRPERPRLWRWSVCPPTFECRVALLA